MFGAKVNRITEKIYQKSRYSLTVFVYGIPHYQISVVFTIHPFVVAILEF